MKNKLVMGALLLASSAVWAAPATTVAAKGSISTNLAVSSLTSPISNQAIRYQRCIVQTNTVSNSGSYEIYPLRMQGLTGPIWVVRTC